MKITYKQIFHAVNVGFLMMLGNNVAHAACSATAAGQTISVVTADGCTGITTSYSGTSITNVNNLTTSTGPDGASLGNAGTAAVLISGGTSASPNIFTNNANILNNHASESGKSQKGILVKGFATINNNGSIVETGEGNPGSNYSSGILYNGTETGATLNVNNLGTIQGVSFGIVVFAGTASIVNGSASNSTALIDSTTSAAGGIGIHGYSNTFSLIENYGVINSNAASWYAIGLNSGGLISSLINHSTGVINGVVLNGGTITTASNAGYMTGFLNSGTIESLTNSAGASLGTAAGTGWAPISNGGTINALVNSGTIYSDYGNPAGGDKSISNGSIWSAGGTINNLSNTATGTIAGGIYNNRNILKTGLAEAAVVNAGYIYGITNAAYGGTGGRIDSVLVQSGGNIGTSDMSYGMGINNDATATIGTITVNAGGASMLGLPIVAQLML